MRAVIQKLRSLISRFAKSPATSPADGLPAHATSYTHSDTSEIWLMLGVGAISLTVYLLTLSPGVCPGASAAAVGRALDLFTSAPATHPLWLLLSRGVSALPVCDTVLRLNIFSAVCGSLAAAWLFRITKRVLFEFIRDVPSLRLVPTDETEQSETLAIDPTDDVMEQVYASLGGLIAAISFAFSAPFWVASTSLHVEPFNILLVLLTADLLLCYHFTGRTIVCVAAMFLLGLGLVESVVFIILAPLALGLVLLTGLRFKQISESFILLLMAAGFTGLASNLVLYILLSSGGHTFSATLVHQALASLAHAHSGDLMAGFLPRTGWVFVFLQTAMPILVALVSIRVLTSLQDEATRWKWGVTNLIMTAFSIACLLNFPKSTWYMARQGGHLPVMSYLTIAVAVGALFVYWCLVATQGNKDNEEYSALGTSSRTLRLLGFGICGLLGIITVRTLHINFNDGDSRKAAFADRMADDILLQAGPVRCLVTDGVLDLNLLIRSHLTGKKVTLVPCLQEQNAAKPGNPEGKAPFILSLPGTEPKQKLSSAAFIEHWLQVNPNGHDQVAVVGNPGILQRAGLIPVPNGLLYVGMDVKQSLDREAVLAGSRVFWRRFATLLAEDRTMRPELRIVHAQVRAKASRMANDLGVLLENTGDLKGAESVYCEALRLDENNLCASLNQQGLRLRGETDPGASQAFAAQAAALTTKPGFLVTFDSAVSLYGMLSPQEADTLLPAVMLNYSLGSKPPENILRLMEKWIGASRAPSNFTPPSIATAAHPTDVQPDAMLSQALAMLLDGQDVKAEKRLRALVLNRPNSLSAWALLADILMARNQLKEVNDVILPAMRAVRLTQENADSTLLDMTQGCLFLRAASANPAKARSCFERALSLNPTLTAACDQLLRVDRMLGNAANLEADALKIVANNPNHPDANAILGSLRLGQKRHAEAEAYLRQSIKALPAAGTLNDLAELLRQQNKNKEAEQQIRLAIRLDPDFYQAWDTLGCILTEAGRSAEAYGTLRCAFALSSNDPRLYLTLTRLHIKEGRLREANQVLDQSRPLFSQTSTSVRDAYAELKQQLASQP